ncbi:MAG: phage recombination protein Bet [Geminicoccaceae bacterium]
MNEIAPIKKGLPDYTPSQVALIKRTVARDCNNDEFDLFVEVCKRVGLDPFRRQIHALVFNKNNLEKRQMAIVTGIGGYRAIAARNGDYRPDEKRPEIEYQEELKDPATNPLGIAYAVVTVNKKDADGWHPVSGIAYWEEYAPVKEEWAYDQDAGKRQPTGKFELDRKSAWWKMPKIMIAKCAEAQALQKGWPEDLSGLYAEEEMHRATVQDLTASEQAEHAEEEKRLQLVNASKSIPILWKAGEQIEFVPDGQIADRIMAFIKDAGEIELETWRRTNQQGLRQFWAQMPADALDIKKAIEQRLQVLRKENQTLLDAG